MRTQPAGASVTVRRAQPDDTPLVAAMVRDIADHEGQAEHVRVDSRGGLGCSSDRTSPCCSPSTPVAPSGTSQQYASSTCGRAGTCSLDDLYVRQDARDQGIGPVLMEELARLAEPEQLVIRWGVEADNDRAQRFYRRLGASLRGKVTASGRPSSYGAVLEQRAPQP